MKRPLPDFHFKIMALLFRFRDFFIPRKKVLEEVGIQDGYSMLDFD